MAMLSEAQKELRAIQNTIQRENKKLELLRKVIETYNEGAKLGSSDLMEAVLACLKENKGHADFDTIVDSMMERYAFLTRQKVSLLLTKCPHTRYNHGMEEWELKEEKIPSHH